MEIDFGGIGKSDAVDRAAALVDGDGAGPAALVNFGGDLAATRDRRDGRPWTIGVEDPARPAKAPRTDRADVTGRRRDGGDARRYVTTARRRLGRILDPRTGRPVEHAPRS
jgi:thiamine biosynthesis lipoprotein